MQFNLFMDMIIITTMRQLCKNKFIYTCYNILAFLKLKQVLQRYAYIIGASKKPVE